MSDKVNAQAWYKAGQLFLQTDTHRYVVDASTMDLLNIKNGFAAAVEMEIRELPPKEEPTS